MSKWMNAWEIEEALAEYRNHPVLSRATKVLLELRDIADSNSDGWCYWPAPARAAKQLMVLIDDFPETATPTTLKKALAPIRSFATRHNFVIEGIK